MPINTPSSEVEGLIKELRMVADMINMGEKIQWARETTLMDKAADILETLTTNHDERMRALVEEIWTIGNSLVKSTTEKKAEILKLLAQKDAEVAKTTNTPSSEVEGIVQEAHQIAVDYMRRVGLKESALKNVPYNHPGHVLLELKEYLRTTLTTLTTNHDERMRALVEEIKSDLQKPPFQSGGDTQWDRGVVFGQRGSLNRVEAIAAKYITSNDDVK